MTRKEIEQRVDALMEQMTLEEKIGQINQASPATVCTLPGVEADIDSWVTEMMEGKISEQKFQERLAMCEENLRLDELEAGEIGCFVNLYDDAKLAQVIAASKKSRLQIPLLVGVDVIRGYRTIFPTPLAMAAAWDPKLHRKLVKTAKKEAIVSGVNWVLGPMLDVARDGRWGRIVESPGEDPYLASVIAKEMVEEYHADNGDGPMICTAKHFAAYGAASGGQDYNTVSISMQQLYETYLPPFRAAVDAGVDCVMSAFHDLNGIPCVCDRELLTDLLRDEMGFQGFVVSDAEAVKQCVSHGISGDEAEAAKMSLLAGNDVDMTSYDYRNYLKKLVEDGQLEEEVIHTVARRVLEKKLEYGLFDKEYVYDPEKIRKIVLSEEHRTAAREVARQTIVLLKNEDVLPVRGKKRILVIGELADDKEALTGPWAFTGDSGKTVTIVEGLRKNAPEGMEISYVKGFGVHDSREGFAEALEKAENADFIVAVAGETAFMSGEAASRADLHLSGAQEEFLLKLAGIDVPKAVLLVNGRPLAIGCLKENVGIGAILETWHLGTESGNAVADVLFGAYNPSAKLTVTFANEAGQEPMYYNHPNTGKPGGSFKFTSKYQDVPIEPLYPFGYGLSYTTFQYSELEVLTPEIRLDSELNCRVKVKNTGDCFGEEIVQLYIHDKVAGCVRPVKELKRFMKIALQPGEQKECEFSLPAAELGYYDRSCNYVVEPGTFDLYIGPDSREGLHMEFELK